MSNHNETPPQHYYGDVVRRLIFSAGVVLLVAIPFDRDLLSFYLTFGVIAVLILAIFAGFTSPRQRWAIVIDLLISSIGFLVFEYLAIARYMETDSFTEAIFILRQIIALLFISAVYFCTKTIRGSLERH